MYKNILLPVDGSDASTHAAEEGFKLASALGSSITLLFVVDISVISIPDAESGIANIEMIRKNFKEQGDKLLGSLTASAREKGVKVETRMAEGDVHEEIIRAAEEKKVDLIIMGTHGRRGLNRLLLGSVAESVTRRANCPVLLIRPA